ncbi:MAG: PD-(D/E)XK nuclease family protein, partial [Dehalococcoidia bacterium]
VWQMNKEGGMTAELYRTIVAVVDERVKEIKVTREDFDRLEAALPRLAAAQKQTEDRVPRLEAALERLAEAQAKTEERMTRLEAAVTRLEAVVERLAEAQAKTEERVSRLEGAVERLVLAQGRVEGTLGALGARWGLFAEESFREGMRAVLEGTGFKVERYLVYDHVGKVFGRPDQVELDLVIHNDKLMLMELKSSLSKGDVALFDRKTGFYEEREGKRADRRILISPFVDQKARALAGTLGMEVYAQPDELGAA